MKASGFAANGIVSWKLVDSDGKVPLKGYFHTDSQGKVNDQTVMDDIQKGHYKIYIGDDTNNDGELESEPVYSDITVPCR